MKKNNKNEILESNNSNDEKINLISFQLEENEIHILETLKFCKCSGNLENINENNMNI